MKAPVLILLLLLMLAPRLSAALPHALACASPLATAATAMQTAGTAPAHQHHQMMAQATDGAKHHGHHGEYGSHHSSTAAADPQTSTGLSADADLQVKGADADCQHCGQCDEHCSVLLIASAARQTEHRASEPLTSPTGQQSAGHSHDLNRPPRTISL